MTDQAAELRAFASQQGVKQPVEVDKAKLWDDFKALLRKQADAYSEAHGGKWSYCQTPEAHAGHFANLMTQAETFARVRAEFKGGE